MPATAAIWALLTVSRAGLRNVHPNSYTTGSSRLKLYKSGPQLEPLPVAWSPQTLETQGELEAAAPRCEPASESGATRNVLSSLTLSSAPWAFVICWTSHKAPAPPRPAELCSSRKGT